MNDFEIRVLKERAFIVAVILGILILGIFNIWHVLKIDRLNDENAVLRAKILQSEKKVIELKKSVDTITLIVEKKVEKIKYLKKTEYVKVKMVDSMPISNIQQYFTDRYKR
jgi:hypothetical protein